ncbi:hypothetical protein ACMA1I_05950 [Pontibacter sp. 13R65]|uniref:hypothetical protein n=1 Tax=Pontibacter sp. 13R65 TaxID=3127458 RepID=UPI00301E28D3
MALPLHRISLFYMLLLLLASGCSVVYTPTMQNVPLMQEKGDLKMVLNPNNLQAAYAVSDHIAVMANGSYNRTKWTISDSSNTTPHTYKPYRYNLEAAVGYYRPVIEKVFMEVYGGAGFGHTHLHNHPIFVGNTSDEPEEQHRLFSADNRKIFIQPTIGLSEDVVELSISSRLVAQQFRNVSTTYSDWYLEHNQLANVDQHTHLFVEPCFTLRVGFKWVKFQTQAIYSAKISRPELAYKPVQLNFALQFNLSKQNRAILFR